MNSKTIVKAALALSLSVLLANCVQPTTTPATTFKQIERLARPGINEALVLTNASLNLWNATPPSGDGVNPSPSYINEAATVLGVLHTYGVTNGAAPPPVSLVVSGFLPDVMRIDTTTSVPLTAPSYNGCYGPNTGIICGGRKPTDDVIRITVNYLVFGDPTGATYDTKLAYADNHTALDTSGPGAFPYLAPPR